MTEREGREEAFLDLLDVCRDLEKWDHFSRVLVLMLNSEDPTREELPPLSADFLSGPLGDARESGVEGEAAEWEIEDTINFAKNATNRIRVECEKLVTSEAQAAIWNNLVALVWGQ